MTTRTGPQRYPGADHSRRYQGTYPGDDMEVNVVVLHTTEGRSLPSYGGGGSAPTLTAVPDLAARKLKWYQHFDIDTSARALVNRSGGVETNTLNVCQVELVGTCDPSTRSSWTKAGLVQDRDFVYWPKAPAWLLAAAAEFLAWMHAEHRVPLTGPAKWPAYPGSYGNGGGQRMTFAQWNDFRGVCGHMHVPENDHGDPGSINFAELLTLAKKATDTPAEVPPKYQPFPGSRYFMKDGKPALGKSSPIFTAMGERLVARGHGRYYSVGPGPRLGQADVDAYQAHQRSMGYSGAAATWPPGPTSWAALKVPYVKEV
ncbi:peptidoglycan-binding protein [Streptomyces antibioticus]|uniref:peptidoglycan-binding protein n=1 Tax=Streptomyces antibioticus TaxID=1890 RepID=UPI0036BEF3ED